MRKFMTAALVGAALLIGGCDSPTGDTGITSEIKPAPAFFARWVLMTSDRKDLPYPNLLFGGNLLDPTKGTLGVPLATTDGPSANIPSVNQLDGFSVSAPIAVPMNAELDLSTIVPFIPTAPDDLTPRIPNPNLWIVQTDLAGNITGVPLPLIPGMIPESVADYTWRVLTSSVDDIKAGYSEFVLEIVPLKPLQSSAVYNFVITSGMADVDGNLMEADNQFQTIRDAHFAGETLTSANLEAAKNFLGDLLDTVAGGFQVPPSDIVVAWNMLTLSVTDTLDYIAETAQPQAIVAQPVPHPVLPRPLNTKDVNDGLFGIADIYAGFVDVPYFFDMANPYGTWSAAGGGSLTRFNPVPEQTGTQRIPMLVTVPNAGSGQAKPVDGWPVVIYLPGLLIDRTTAIGIADAYAQAGFAVVAIDLPLHGVICPVDNLACNPFLVPPGNPAGILERHFYLDKFGSRESGYDPATPDGIIDDGGQAARIGTVGALGMPGPLWVRDLIRQGTSDLIHLRRSLDNLDLDGIAGGDIDTSKVNFMGFSTGSNIGVVFLGTDPGITTATLANGGGPWVYLLADPEAQGLGTIVKTVAAQLGAVPGSVRASYLQRDYMNAVDAGDVWNYAAKASANTAINAHLVLTDQTVTNGASRSMAKAMKIPTVTTAGPIGSPLPDSPPISAMVEFSQGGHGSILDPCAEVIDFGTQAVLSEPNPSVTVEMQTEAATFAATRGTFLPVSCTGADCVGGPPVSICTP